MEHTFSPSAAGPLAHAYAVAIVKINRFIENRWNETEWIKRWQRKVEATVTTTTNWHVIIGCGCVSYRGADTALDRPIFKWNRRIFLFVEELFVELIEIWLVFATIHLWILAIKSYWKTRITCTIAYISRRKKWNGWDEGNVNNRFDISDPFHHVSHSVKCISSKCQRDSSKSGVRIFDRTKQYLHLST